MRSHRGALGSPRDVRADSTSHSSRTLAVATQVNYGRPSDAPSGFPVTVSLHRPRSALLASSLFIYMRPRRPLCRWKSTLGCHAADPAYYCITAAAAGRVTNGDRSPPGSAGLTCCRSAQSHHLDVVAVG